MSQATEQLKEELARLSEQDRAELAYFLLRSLDGPEDTDYEAAWDAELARRDEEIMSGKVTGEPAEQVFSRLREKYK